MSASGISKHFSNNNLGSCNNFGLNAGLGDTAHKTIANHLVFQSTELASGCQSSQCCSVKIAGLVRLLFSVIEPVTFVDNVCLSNAMGVT